MSDDAQKAEELLQQGGQKLHEAEAPEQSAETDDDTPTLQAAITDAYAAIDEGDAHTNLTVRDEDLAALVAGLDDADELEGIITAAQDALDRDPDASDATRAKALGLLLRVGLSNVAPETIETAVDAKQAHLSNQASEF